MHVGAFLLTANNSAKQHRLVAAETAVAQREEIFEIPISYGHGDSSGEESGPRCSRNGTETEPVRRSPELFSYYYCVSSGAARRDSR